MQDAAQNKPHRKRIGREQNEAAESRNYGRKGGHGTICFRLMLVWQNALGEEPKKGRAAKKVYISHLRCLFLSGRDKKG